MKREQMIFFLKARRASETLLLHMCIYMYVYAYTDTWVCVCTCMLLSNFSWY